ncbi:MAG: hypothetical protein AAB506_02000, partial [Patescibacteria group bacterium]
MSEYPSPKPSEILSGKKSPNFPTILVLLSLLTLPPSVQATPSKNIDVIQPPIFPVLLASAYADEGPPIPAKPNLIDTLAKLHTPYDFSAIPKSLDIVAPAYGLSKEEFLQKILATMFTETQGGKKQMQVEANTTIDSQNRLQGKIGETAFKALKIDKLNPDQKDMLWGITYLAFCQEFVDQTNPDLTPKTKLELIAASYNAGPGLTKNTIKFFLENNPKYDIKTLLWRQAADYALTNIGKFRRAYHEKANEDKLREKIAISQKYVTRGSSLHNQIKALDLKNP